LDSFRSRSSSSPPPAATGLASNQLHKADGSRVKQVIYCAAEDKPIPAAEIVKGYEYEKELS